MSKIKKTARNDAPKKPSKDMTARDFMALSEAQKERVFQAIKKQHPAERLAQSRPLNAREGARWQRFKKMRRPE
jgi:hypothetical protein